MKSRFSWAVPFPAALVVLAAAWHPGFSRAQTNAPADPIQQRLKALEATLDLTQEKLAKQIGDLMWFQRLADIAAVDKIRYTGPPLRVTNNPTAQGAGNELIVAAYTFLRSEEHTSELQS